MHFAPDTELSDSVELSECHYSALPEAITTNVKCVNIVCTSFSASSDSVICMSTYLTTLLDILDMFVYM